MQIELTPAARDYVRALAPEPRRQAKAALLALAQGKGDIKPLTDELEGFYRLRVGQHRYVFRREPGRILVFIAAPRAIVYEYLAAHIRDYLG